MQKFRRLLETFKGRNKQHSHNVTLAMPTMRIGILDLPRELIDDILAFIDGHGDLVNLACTSKLFKSLIVPWHTEYRVLRVNKFAFGATAGEVLNHLKTRSDLTRNIRVVHLPPYSGPPPNLEYHNRFPRHFLRPTHLPRLKGPVPLSPEQLQAFSDVISTLEGIRTFIWSSNGLLAGEEAPSASDVLEQLANKPYLTHLEFFGTEALRGLREALATPTHSVSSRRDVIEYLI